MAPGTHHNCSRQATLANWKQHAAHVCAHSSSSSSSRPPGGAAGAPAIRLPGRSMEEAREASMEARPSGPAERSRRRSRRCASRCNGQEKRALRHRMAAHACARGRQAGRPRSQAAGQQKATCSCQGSCGRNSKGSAQRQCSCRSPCCLGAAHSGPAHPHGVASGAAPL